MSAHKNAYENSGFNSVNDSIASQRDFSLTTDGGHRSAFKDTFKKVPVQVYGAQRNVDTPDSVASNPKRLIWSTGGGSSPQHNIDATNLQQQYNKNGAKSMRDLYSESRAKQEPGYEDLAFGQNDSKQGARSMREVYGGNEKKQGPGYEHLTFEFPSKDLRRNKKERTSSCDKVCCLKCGVFISCVCVLIAAIVMLVYFKSNSSGDADKLGSVYTTKSPITTAKPVVTTPSIATCEPLPVNLQDKMEIRCLDLTYIDRIHTVVVKPPPYMNEGRNITMAIGETNNTSWIPEIDIAKDLFMVHGPDATCSSSGIYTLYFYKDDGDVLFYTRNLNVTVISEVKRVNISLSQQITTDNTTDFTIGCSTNSGCEQSFVDFFAEINKEEQYLRGVNFTCTITYNDYDGYSVSCIGVIPEFLLAQFERITCKPRSRLLDDLDEDELTKLEQEFELKECDLLTHCGYECTKDIEDYFAVDSYRCDIFHRCVGRRVYTSYCSPGTFFDPRPENCACKHRQEVTWCRQDGAISPDSPVPKETCANQMIPRK
ncbi:uncharacterized protein LOC128218779 isoform X2 [Mya arenaria]|uniref:uncharacterized protein LOC128218779 isoform X2 n=1 Tax=Mya arenaria TaxID=6604 RepID=UPI0022E26042|nr:uncharacterized protein LOC128218779 isoform X2 [Mya arenaria]